MQHFLIHWTYLIASMLLLQACGYFSSNDDEVDVAISSVESTCSSGEVLSPVSGSGNFSIPENTVSFVVHALSNDYVKPSFTSLSSPDGINIKSLLSDNRSDIPWQSYKYSNVLIPSSTSYQATSGTWNYTTSSTSTLCLTTREGSVSSTPTITVQPYITGSTYSASDISSALSTMSSIYSQNGVSLTIKTTETISDSEFSSVSSDFTNSVTSELITKGSYDRVNLFFIYDYTDASYYGNSAGIPGSQGLKGSHNGVLISINSHVSSGTIDDQLLAETAGHEMGHFLGLWHLAEGYLYTTYGLDYDLISDTPACPSSMNSNSNSHLTAEECGTTYGADNLMFWDPWDDGDQDNLTTGQVYVLKYSLIAN